ncbi:MAG: hypothetical protein RBT53_02465 [Azonexus sp.]|jgi:O-antigen/teichoic acid export membrane protein|nr:hypothetical protein [Azonexus sp.]
MAGKTFVDANYRFIAGYQEVNARIVQRQQALALYVTLTATLLAGLLAMHPGSSGRQLPVEWLIFGFPLTALCLAFLNYKAERAITNLRAFLATLERLEHAHQALPSYNTDPRWSSGINKVRRFHDIACATLAAGANAIGIGVVLQLYPERLAGKPFILFLLIGGAIASVVALLVIPRWSYRPLEDDPLSSKEIP